MWKIAVADTAEDHLTLLKDALKSVFPGNTQGIFCDFLYRSYSSGKRHGSGGTF